MLGQKQHKTGAVVSVWLINYINGVVTNTFFSSQIFSQYFVSIEFSNYARRQISSDFIFSCNLFFDEIPKKVSMFKKSQRVTMFCQHLICISKCPNRDLSIFFLYVGFIHLIIHKTINHCIKKMILYIVKFEQRSFKSVNVLLKFVKLSNSTQSLFSGS